MASEAPDHQPRSQDWIRWAAGLTVPVLISVAVVTAFPELIGSKEPRSLFVALLMAWAAFFFFNFSAGTFRRERVTQKRLLAAAQGYLAGEMTLEEFGTRVKSILQK